MTVLYKEKQTPITSDFSGNKFLSLHPQNFQIKPNKLKKDKKLTLALYLSVLPLIYIFGGFKNAGVNNEQVKI